MIVLAIAFAVCGQQFGWRNEIFKPAPDGYVRGITAKQLKDFIQEPEDLTRKSKCCVTPDMQKTFFCRVKEIPHKQLYYVATEATTDVAFPLVYGTILGLVFWWLFGHAARIALLLPVAVVVADLTENATLIGTTLTFYFRENAATVPAWAVWPTSVKWGLAVLSLIVAVYGLLRKCWSFSPHSSPASQPPLS